LRWYECRNKEEEVGERDEEADVGGRGGGSRWMRKRRRRPAQIEVVDLYVYVCN